MATKTIINCLNGSQSIQSGGISIIIDPQSSPTLQKCEQKHLTENCTIVRNNNIIKLKSNQQQQEHTYQQDNLQQQRQQYQHQQQKPKLSIVQHNENKLIIKAAAATTITTTTASAHCSMNALTKNSKTLIDINCKEMNAPQYVDNDQSNHANGNSSCGSRSNNNRSKNVDHKQACLGEVRNEKLSSFITNTQLPQQSAEEDKEEGQPKHVLDMRNHEIHHLERWINNACGAKQNVKHVEDDNGVGDNNEKAVYNHCRDNDHQQRQQQHHSQSLPISTITTTASSSSSSSLPISSACISVHQSNNLAFKPNQACTGSNVRAEESGQSSQVNGLSNRENDHFILNASSIHHNHNDEQKNKNNLNVVETTFEREPDDSRLLSHDDQTKRSLEILSSNCLTAKTDNNSGTTLQLIIPTDSSSVTLRGACESKQKLAEQSENIQNNHKNINTTHVVKIQIHSQEKPFARKRVSVVKIENSPESPLNEEQLNRVQTNLITGKMVQKPATMAKSATTSARSTPLTTSATTVTDLNATNSNQNYTFYIMSSGQFSPCDTLDSGTGSDLESSGQQQNSLTNLSTAKQNGSGFSPPKSTKTEMLPKTTKVRVNNTTNCTFTDSEESEASSISSDSLHSHEFTRQCSATATSVLPINKSKSLASYLPDSLLRDIRGLKFHSQEYEAEGEEEEEEEEEEDDDKVAHNSNCKSNDDNYETINSQSYDRNKRNVQEQINGINATNGSAVMHSSSSSSLKRDSLPTKTFRTNTDKSLFEDTKMNTMPRKYDADKYYEFHINEHDNYRKYNSLQSSDGSDSVNNADEYATRSLYDDAFAGYRDLRCGSTTSTIRSSKGTVRGVKNRVRNGIATFLQLQHPNVKNYKEKDSGKVVLYTTSMGIIRDTYAKCSNVKQILRTLLVKFEERDVFMSLEYQQEIKERMDADVIKVPQLFVEGQYIGDADIVERLNESGELRQLLKPYKSITTAYTCQTCGGYRLLPCPSCNGSKKSVHRNHFTAEFVALKCMNCDEVGLVKCHNC